MPLVLALAGAPKNDRQLSGVLSGYCLDCHSGERPKGQLDLSSATDASERASTRVLRSIRDRLRSGDMPPSGKDRPDAAAYLALVNEINETIDARAGRAQPGRPTLPRLNRTEFRNSVRDLIGVDVDVNSALPADDVGEGFDHIGDVLSMPPILFEKYLDVAERAALFAWPDAVESTQYIISGGKLRIRSGGKVQGDDAVVWSAGAAEAEFEIPRDGRYRIRVRAFGDQAGPEPVKLAITAGKGRVAYFDLSETRAAPGTRTCEATISRGTRRLGVEFLNDFYREDLPEGHRDRNLHVLELSLDGPIDTVAPTRQATAFAGNTPTLEQFLEGLLTRAFRRPVTEDERNAFAARVRAATPSGTAWPLVARTAITAALVDPRFLFRIERDPENSRSTRDLDGYEIATRLSYACWRSMPDDELFAAARDGRLDSSDGLRSVLARLLDDPRSLAIAEHFGQQWLFVRGVDEKQPDPQLFPGVDISLLRDMKAETTLFVDRMLRERRPLRELLTADWSFLNARLAKHYAIEGVDGDWLRLVRIGDQRVHGLLGHASVLVSTSNPTRTSPVKRGKWVLEALLDAPPPPPPPGVPALPERAEPAGGASMRELLARHRADPSCAACHRRMDAIGLALEPLDAVGRERTTDGGLLIDARTELPDGRQVDGPRTLTALLADDPAIVRSVVRHLFVYVLGRGLGDDDEATVDRIARSLGSSASLRDAFEAIVLSEQFRRRGAAETRSSKESS